MWDYFPYQGSNPLPWNHGVSTTGLPGKSQGPICFCFSVYPQHLAHYQFNHFNHSVVSDSVRPHRRQPTRLPRPWDTPGKNTGVGCHFLLQCMKVKSESEVTQSCPTLSDPMDYSLSGSSVHGIFQSKSTGVGCHCLLCILTW